MIVVAAFAGFLALTQPQTSCADVASCRAMAETARESKDYEAFHDLAWAAYRKAKDNDPELMLLVARAQSLSGRPGDALVMIERLAAIGQAGDALTSEDFARVRALPRWPEVAEKIAAPAPSAKESISPSANAVKPADKPMDKPAAKPVTPAAKEPVSTSAAKAPAPDKPAAKEPATPPKEPASTFAANAASTSAGGAASTFAAGAATVDKTVDKPADKRVEKPSASAPDSPAPSAKSSANVPLSFTTLLTPDALAYDAVSRRFIIADRRARRVAVVDEHTGQVATLVGAQGALGEISGIAIDPSQGDLWVISMGEDGPSLHRMQLISGRMLTTVSLAIDHPVSAMAWVPGSGLVVADSNGVVWAVRPSGQSQKLAALEYAPRGFAADARGRLYVAGGTSRIARFTVGATLRKIDTIELETGIPANAPFAVSGNRLHFIVPGQGTFEVRSVAVK